MTLVKLFWSFFQIGLFSIGGGYAAMPLIQNQMVDIHQWITMTEFTDLITIAEMTPGPIAVNSATFVGTHIAGLTGAIVATIGCVLPSGVIVSVLANIYFRYQNINAIQGVLNGLRPAVVALIASAGASIFSMAVWGQKGFPFWMPANWLSLGMFCIALFVLRKWKPSPILVMLGCGVIGGLTCLFI